MRVWLGRLAIVLPVLLLAYLAVTFLAVHSATGRDDAAGVEERPGFDAVVVLGAAQYDGTPSPVLAARLDHAHGLWEEGIAPKVVVTGSKRPGDRFTEAFAGFRYLRRHGVPEDDIIVITDGGNTYESLAAARPVLRERGVDRLLLVSDSYHSARLLAIGDELGLDVGVSPTSAEVPSRSLLRETLAVALGRIISYRRTVRLS